MSNASASSIVWNGLSVSAGSSPAPAAAPKGLIVTRALQVKKGWIGQLIVADEIVWESKAKKTADEAEEEATERVATRLRSLLA